MAGHVRLDGQSHQRGVAAMPNISRTQRLTSQRQLMSPGDGRGSRFWAGQSIGFSLVFACATPFVALVTLAALTMSRRDAFIVTGAVWLANQAVGLRHPRLPAHRRQLRLGHGDRRCRAARSSDGARRRRHNSSGAARSSRRASPFCRRSPSMNWRSMPPPSGCRAATRRSWATVGYILQVNALGLVSLIVLELRRGQFRARDAPSVHIIHSSGRPRGRARHILRPHLGRSRCPVAAAIIVAHGKSFWPCRQVGPRS